MEVYFGGAEEQGITEEEMAAVRAMVMAVSAGRILYQSELVMEKMMGASGGAQPEQSPRGCL